MTNTKTASFIVMITFTFLLMSGVLVLKNQVQGLEKQLVSINKNIQDDIKTIHVLKAEWSHLNNPTRLRQLAAKHISLNPVQAEQIINYSALPFEYEGDDSRRDIAQKNISGYAERNKVIKKLVKAHR